MYVLTNQRLGSAHFLGCLEGRHSAEAGSWAKRVLGFEKLIIADSAALLGAC